MLIEQLYTGCLAQGAYYIESDGVAAVIDPLRDTQAYTFLAARSGARIAWVLETHFHADFVSGHLALAEATGAQIVYGPTAKPAFPAHIATDGEELALGSVFIRVLHTPGHTLESCSYLLLDADHRPVALFSGDTLLLGDVGRPDLAQKIDAALTPAHLAGLLYDSLREKILPLPGDIVVYPGHGAGSACGKNLSRATSDTLGNQKANNYALQPSLSKEAFVEAVLTGLMPSPAYFPANVLRNISGAEAVEQVRARLKPLDPDSFLATARKRGAVLLDVRDPDTFAAGFVPGSWNIGIDGAFAPWAGALIPDLDTAILLIAPEERAEEAVTRLARVGLDNVPGYLAGGTGAWLASGGCLEHIVRVSPDGLANLQLLHPDLQLVDVRKQSEFDSEHIEGALNAPLDYIDASIRQLDPARRVYLYCAGGYRSMIFASILRARGFSDVVDIKGGFAALKASGRFGVTEYVCPTTML
ncbi:MAG: MBL fold metallo-hydrolase [Chitinophagaceae bacterium]|nr:MAG: MBL fold metallo-hydrolase [Chitinophagaceae bacterium]